MNSVETTITALRQRTEQTLEQYLPPEGQTPQQLHQAMRYAVLGGGKRIRPILVYSAATAVQADLAQVDAAAAAVELIHAYSLVHDDLPAMDNDDLRRGRPPCHKAFNEATAILVGDALQALAFQTLADNTLLPASSRLQQVRVLTEASGAAGMVGGQALDLASVGQPMDIEGLETLNRMKTGALIRASVLLGALGRVDITAADLTRLSHYAECVGLAFQIQDDILDITSDTATLGKTQGSDQARDKPTYPMLLGLEPAQRRAGNLCAEAQAHLEPFGERASVLSWLADFIVQRLH